VSVLVFALASCLTISSPPIASAQVPAPPPSQGERERWALVGIWAPGLQRIGLLIPLGERVLLRPDIAGEIWSYEGIEEGWLVNPGISLIVRSRPVEKGWIYVSLRSAFRYEEYSTYDYSDWIDAYTLTFGGHSLLTDVLSVFGEAGPSYTYHESGSDTEIEREYVFVARFGFAIRRPRKR
jgi:hypothetical protein